MSDSSGQARGAHATVLAEYAAHLVDVTGRFGVKPDVLLKGTGIRASALEQPDGLVPREGFLALIRRALALTHEPGLGFYYGLSLKLSAHGGPGLLAMTSGTLGDALMVAVRFVHLRDRELTLTTRHEGDELWLEFTSASPPELQSFSVESFFVMLVHVARALVGHPVNVKCEFAFSEPAHFQRFAHLLPSRVRHRADKNRLRLPLALLQEAVVTSDSVMARRIERDLQRELEQLDERASYLSRVRKRLGHDLPSLEVLAARLNTSTRTLKRRLASHGTSYRQLLEELRRERALMLLRDSDQNIAQIADQLGYTDRASFHRAWKRWFGTTPQSAR